MTPSAPITKGNVPNKSDLSGVLGPLTKALLEGSGARGQRPRRRQRVSWLFRTAYCLDTMVHLGEALVDQVESRGSHGSPWSWSIQRDHSLGLSIQTYHTPLSTLKG